MVANTGGSLLLLTCLALGTVVQARWLNQFVRHFEPLSYPPLPVHRGHMRVRRSLAHREQQRPGHVYLRFGGFNRIFQLKLRPDTSVFHKDLVVETSRFGRVKPDISHIYSGELVGDPSSRVFGGLHGGVFEGSIQSRRGHFYVEAAHKFFSRGTPFHSLLYSIRDVRMPSAGGAHGWCGVRGETARWMSQLAAHSRLVQPPHKERPLKRTNLERWLGRRPLEVAKHTEDYDDVEADDDDDDDNVDDGHGGGSNSSRRSSRRSRPHPNRVCGLFVSIDHLLYEKFSEADAGDPVRTRERLSTLIAGHVARASQVYRKTSFGGIQDVSFNVHRIQINDTSSCQKSRTGFCQENMDPSLFLLTLAKWKKFDDYCLAYAWTYRDFDSGTLGLAYVANSSSDSAGLCDRNRLVPADPGKPASGLVKINLNTGIMTFVNYGHYVGHAVSELVLCHEVGHNFGSPHDEPDSSPCVPVKEKGGHYIMFPHASKGNEPNNDRFSKCSIANMTNIIKPMLDGTSKRENCLEEDSGPICGNHIVEGQEKCDCGFTEAECTEKCCYPREAGPGLACTLKKGKMCSPSAGHCCEQDCTFSDSSKVCNPPTECRNESFCTGDNATCPQGAPVANMTGCNNNTQVCVSGECEGSVCLMYGLSECTLSGSAYSIDQKCLVTCIHDGKCKPTCEIPEMKALCGLRMQPGATCDETRGYCDVFRKCRHVDEKGPLARLEEALFGGGVIKSLKAYILEHPFWSFVFFLLFVLVMVVFFRCFSQHTPSNNPHKPHRKWRK